VVSVDIIIIAILVILIAYGLKETIKHFKGEGACCGGGSSKPKKKKLNGNICCMYTFKIEGMHCQNCANTVMRAVNDIEGASAKVSYKRKIAKVYCDRQIDEQIIKEAICKRGYKVI